MRKFCRSGETRRLAKFAVRYGIEKAAAAADEGARKATDKLPQEAAASNYTFLLKQHLCYLSNSPLCLRLSICPSLTHFLNAAVLTSSVMSAPARRAAYGFAVCGRRRLSPPPLSCGPLRGQQDAASAFFCTFLQKSRRRQKNNPAGLDETARLRYDYNVLLCDKEKGQLLCSP